MKKGTVPWEILLGVIILFLSIAFGALIVLGKDFQMNMKAEETHKKLVEAFIEVANNPDKYDYYSRYGGGKGENAKKCNIPYTSKKPCGIAIVLPQELHTLSKDALPALGDPKYIIYWDSYDNVESAAWSGWFWVDAILIVLPAEKVLATGLKAGSKATKYLVKYGLGFGTGGAAKTVAEKLGKGVVKLGRNIRLLKEGEEEIAEEGFEYVIKNIENSDDDVVKALEEIGGVITQEDVESGKAMEKVKDYLKQKADDAYVLYGSTSKVSVIIVAKENFLKGSRILEKTIGREETSRIKAFIESNKAWICSVSGATLGMELPRIIDALKENGYIESEDAEYYYYKGGIEIPKEIANAALWSLLLRKVTENGKTKIKSLVFKTDPNSPVGYIIEEVDLLDVTSKTPEDWIRYEITYDPNTKQFSSKKLGKVKEILENDDLKLRTAGDCFYGAALTFAPIFAIHSMEAKYETVKGEAEKCKNAVCFKGSTIAPKTYKKDELMKVMKDSKVCGVKIANVKGETLEYPAFSGKKTLTLPGGEKISYDSDVHEFYLVSPCFAYAQIWVAKCDDPRESCPDTELCSDWYNNGKCEDENNCCRRCIWVSLQKGKNLPFQENSAFNYCALSASARTVSYGVQMPWPWAGYWKEINLPSPDVNNDNILPGP